MVVLSWPLYIVRYTGIPEGLGSDGVGVMSKNIDACTA